LTAGEVVSSMALYLRDIAPVGEGLDGEGGGGDVSPSPVSACHPKTSLPRSPPRPASAHPRAPPPRRPSPPGSRSSARSRFSNRPAPAFFAASRTSGALASARWAVASCRSASRPGSSRKTGLPGGLLFGHPGKPPDGR